MMLIVLGQIFNAGEVVSAQRKRYCSKFLRAAKCVELDNFLFMTDPVVLNGRLPIICAIQLEVVLRVSCDIKT